jgi:phosphoribosylamine---glycine ligase
MRVLIVGSGGREHALGWKLSQSPLLEKLYFAPGNPGTACLGENLNLADHERIVGFCTELGVDLVVVGPEAPLVEGLADQLGQAGIACFGPSKAAARLEGSKAFAKEIMAAADVPTAAYASFTDVEAALAYARSQKHPLVVKADGLAAGKGVVICATIAESEVALRDMMEAGRFGEAGARVVLEEFLEGTEASFHVLCDGDVCLPLIAARDHKTLLEGGRGPNTGGMGTVAPNPAVDQAMAHRIRVEVCEPVMRVMRQRGTPFQGVLFVGLMLTANGPKVLEFNVRFGDPETQVMMPLLDFDLLPVLHGAARGWLPAGDHGFKTGSAVCVVMAAAGYPETPRRGDLIQGIPPEDELSIVFQAGTRSENDNLYTHGGRVLGVTAWAATLSESQTKAYEICDQIEFAGKQFRSDIGGIMNSPKVTILMGSENDYDTMEESVKMLKQFQVPFEVFVTSAHRTPERTVQIIDDAVNKGVKVFIIGAGAAAHLAGVVAAHTTLPVIGVPIDSSSLKGVDALYSTVMMPGGIPVASMAIGKAGAQNAGLFAVSILSTSDTDLVEKLAAYRAAMVDKVTARSEALQARVNA